MSKDLVIVGTGGFGRGVMEMIAEESTTYNILGFIDDKQEVGSKVNGFEVIGNTEFLINYQKPISVFICLGDTKPRACMFEKLRINPLIEFPNYISTTVIHSIKTLSMGIGNIITCGCIVSCNVTIGDFNYVAIGSTLGHDLRTFNFVTISPGCNVCGNVIIEKNVYLGANSCVKQGVLIGENTMIGMGSVVVSDIPSGATAFGNPCKVKR